MHLRAFTRFTTIYVSIISIILTVATIGYATYQKKQFYPTVIHITKSSPSMAVIYIQGAVLLMLAGKGFARIFFGNLRPAEVEHLVERAWYAITETCLAFTVFRDDFSTRFIIMFALLLFFKCFHWLTEDRIDYMERTPVISFKFHVRATALLIVLSLIDCYFIRYAYSNVVNRGASVQIVFGFEYMILGISVLGMMAHYVLHTVDSWQSTAWDHKSAYLLYVDLILNFCRVILYALFLTLMLRLHTFPLYLVRPAYLSVSAFKKSLRDVILSRRAIRYMNTMFPSLSPAEVTELGASDSICIICREDMSHGGQNNAPTTQASVVKRLPCQHVFHAHCLRTWFQRQQTCPTCRMDILRQMRGPTAAAAGAGQPPARAAAAQPAPSVTPPSATPAQATSTAAPVAPPFPLPPWMSAPTSSTSQGTSFPPFPFPPPPFMAPPMMPGFLLPPTLSSVEVARMSDEELRQLEGRSREAVQARLQCLERVRLLLDAAMLQMNAYTQALVLTQGVADAQPQRDRDSLNREPNLTQGSSSSGGFFLEPDETVSSSAGEAGTSSPQGNSARQSPSKETEDDDERAMVRQRRLKHFDSTAKLGSSAVKEEDSQETPRPPSH